MVQAKRKSGDVNQNDIAYMAGLFDGEGSVDFAKRTEKKKGKAYKVQRILMRIEMTDESVLNWVHETLGVGTLIAVPSNLPAR